MLANAANDLEPVAVGQVQVENDEIGLTPFVARDRLACCLGGLHLEAVSAQVRPKRPPHRWLVVDDDEPRPGPSRATLIPISDPAGENFAAFSTRFERTCWIST